MSHNVLMRATQLVSSLSPQEKNVVVNVVNATRNPNSKKSKLLEAFESLNELNPGVKPENRKLLELLENRVLDCLLMDVNLLRQGKYTNDEQLVLTLQKEGIKSRILYNKGVVKRAYEVAETCIAKAKKTESFDIILNLLHQQISMICFHQNERAFLTKLEEIDLYESQRSIKLKAIRLYRELKMKKFHGITENLDLFLKIGLDHLENYHSKASLASIDFIILFFEREIYELEGEIIDALSTTVELYSLCRETPECPLVYSLYELAYDQARYVYQLGRVDEAKFLLEKCITQLPMENHACQKSFELLFTINVKAGKFERAGQLLSQLKGTSYFESLMPIKDKATWAHKEAYLCFTLHNHKKCLRVLSINNFKPLSNIERLEVRLLRIMALIEMDYLDIADKQIEATRKFMERKKIDGENCSEDDNDL